MLSLALRLQLMFSGWLEKEEEKKKNQLFTVYMGIALALCCLMLSFPLSDPFFLCVVFHACTYVISNGTTVFPFGFNFSITQIPQALQVAWLLTYVN